MSEPLRFAKMHGLGNDFMVIDLVTQDFQLRPPLIRRWADRKTGIGFDQLLAVEPPTVPDVDFDYRIFNADGSPAEQCGNGARCIVRFIHDRQLTFKPSLTLACDGGRVHGALAGREVEIELEAPSADADAVPFKPAQGDVSPAEREGAWRIDTTNGSMDVTPVSIGNPHGVIFVERISSAPVAETGDELSRHPCFPEGANIGFCEIVDRGYVRLRVHERGVGETRACGTGACAAVVAGRLHGRLDPKVKVSLPGGKVWVHWQGADAPVRMAGAATLVYEGSLTP